MFVRPAPDRRRSLTAGGAHWHSDGVMPVGGVLLVASGVQLIAVLASVAIHTGHRFVAWALVMAVLAGVLVALLACASRYGEDGCGALRLCAALSVQLLLVVMLVVGAAPAARDLYLRTVGLTRTATVVDATGGESPDLSTSGLPAGPVEPLRLRLTVDGMPVKGGSTVPELLVPGVYAEYLRRSRPGAASRAPLTVDLRVDPLGVVAPLPVMNAAVARTAPLVPAEAYAVTLVLGWVTFVAVVAPRRRRDPLAGRPGPAVRR